MSYAGSVVEEWYEAVPLDTERMKELLDPEVEFHVCAGWPNGGTYHGHEGVLRDFFPTASVAWEALKVEVDEAVAVEDTYVVRGRYVGTATGTGAPFSVEFIHLWRINDGKIVNLRQVADSAILADALAGRESTGVSAS